MARPTAATAGSPPTPSVRERIIEGAADLFRENGYDVSMEAIAQAAGVSKQSLYNHFGSKEELFKSIISLRSEALRAPLLEAGGDRDPRAVLLDFARQYHALALSARGAGFMRTIVSASQRFPEIGADFFEVGPRRTLELLTDWVRRQEQAGRLSTPNAALAAEHFLSLLFGYTQLKGMLGLEAQLAAVNAEERAAFCVDLFMRAFGGPVNRL